MRTNTKVRMLRAIARPGLGRAVARLTGDSIPIGGARINTASPLVQDVTRARLALRQYERAELRFVRRYLRHGLDVIELGSSIGVVGSIVLGRLEPGRRLIAVEADPDLGAIARNNFAANAKGSHWTLAPAAISYGSQEGIAFVKGDLSTGGHMARAPGTGGGESIERLTLSDLCARHQVGDFALIADIEGAEAGIIREDAAALSRCRQMIIELHSADGMSITDMRASLVDDHGFTVVAARGPVLVLER